MSQEPPLVVTLRGVKCVTCVQRPRTDKREAVALLRDCLCFVLGQLRPLRWCGHEAIEEPEEGHFEPRAPTGCYFEVRQVCFLCAEAKNGQNGSRSVTAGLFVLRFGSAVASQVVRSRGERGAVGGAF